MTFLTADPTPRHMDAAAACARAALALTFSLCLGVWMAAAVQPAAAIGADGYSKVEREAAFEDVWQDLQDAVINRGLKIDYIGHLDKMLERTSEVAGSVTPGGSKTPYLNAKYVQFCSAKLTHQSVSANPYNIAICPFVIFVFEAKVNPGTVVIGYRKPIPGPSRMTRKAFADIEALLASIIKEAGEGW